MPRTTSRPRAIGVGIVASLLKGLDYEEALAAHVRAGVPVRAQPAFDRRAAFFETRFSAVWVATVLGALGASIWLGLFAFKHVDYSNELWWQFELRGEASRFLRASVGAAVVVLLFGVARLVRPAPHEVEKPTDEDLRDAAARSSPASRGRRRPASTCATRDCSSTRTAPASSCTASRGGPGWRSAIRSGRTTRSAA